MIQQNDVLEKGYMDASLRTIAQNAGVSTSTIYTRYADKAGLFRFLVEPAAEGMKELLQSSLTMDAVLEYIQGMGVVRVFHMAKQSGTTLEKTIADTQKKNQMIERQRIPYIAAELQKAIEALTEGKTIIMIAHRLKTVKKPTRLLSLIRGKSCNRVPMKSCSGMMGYIPVFAVIIPLVLGSLTDILKSPHAL